MQTRTIDKRTDRILQECLRVDRPVAALAYDYAANDHVPVHEHPKAQLIYAIEGTMTVTTREDQAFHLHEKCSSHAHPLLR